ncbi:MAG: GMC family oxidoreductase [Anaerolineae bacterium]|nr:GMC family oxidoreductase [Anaerolineae bacterium]
MVRCEVQRVQIEQGIARGVEAVCQGAGQAHPVAIRARRVVLAAGALHTPALLLRSGLSHAQIGQNLHLHPATAVYGRYKEPIQGWSGVLMSRAVRSLSNLDGRGYGVLLETAPLHPGIAAMNLPWQSGYQHKATMRQLAHLANIVIITCDRYGGRVVLNSQGAPRVHYTLSPYDAKHLMTGILEALRIHAAAGAHELSAPYTLPYLYHPGQSPQPLEAYLAAIQARGLPRNAFALLSAHQMASCRMAANARQGALRPSGETWEIRHLYVADASALPTAPGVNPMLTIMALAYCTAEAVLASLPQ